MNSSIYIHLIYSVHAYMYMYSMWTQQHGRILTDLLYTAVNFSNQANCIYDYICEGIFLWILLCQFTVLGTHRCTMPTKKFYNFTNVGKLLQNLINLHNMKNKNISGLVATELFQYQLQWNLVNMNTEILTQNEQFRNPCCSVWVDLISINMKLISMKF